MSEQLKPVMHINPMVVGKNGVCDHPTAITFSNRGACGAWTLPLYALPAGCVVVSREVLERISAHLEWDGSPPIDTIQYAYKCDGLAAELRALLTQQGQEVKP